MIYITGDCHADWKRFSADTLLGLSLTHNTLKSAKKRIEDAEKEYHGEQIHL